MSAEGAPHRERLETLEQQTLHALKIHQMWRATVRKMLARGSDGSAPVPEKTCPIYTWLARTLDGSFRALPLYEQSLEAHARYHCAVEALRDAPAGDPEPATLAATELKDCLEEWLTISRRR